MGALTDRIAIITGAAGGIGRGCAERFSDEGAKLVLTDINADGLAEVVSAIKDRGNEVIGVTGDIAIEADIDAVVSTAIEAYGQIDALANIAQGGLDEHCDLESATVEVITHALTTGVVQSMLFMQKAFPHMRARGYGRIINTASHAALLGLADFAPYEMTKGAIMALSRNASQAWGKYGIRTNTVLPGARTAAYDVSNAAWEQADAFAVQNPIGRMGDPYADVAPVYVFLASEAADYVNGQVLGVDGGTILFA
jgi:3-oxoacyl-[acyl-carrier protein] reductase